MGNRRRGVSTPVPVPTLNEAAMTGSEVAGAANGTALRTISPWSGAIDGGSTANQDVIQVQSGAVRTGLAVASNSNVYAVTNNPQGWSRKITGKISALPASSVTLGRVYAIRKDFNNTIYFNIIYTQDANAGISSIAITKRILGINTTLVTGDFFTAGNRLQLNDDFVIEMNAADITLKAYRSGVQRGPTVTYSFASAGGTVAAGNISEVGFFTKLGFDTLGTQWDIGNLVTGPLDRLGIDYIQPVLQRGSGATTQVTVTGTMVPGTTALEAKLVNSDGSTVTGFDWAAVTAALGTRRWAFFANVPTGGNYRWNVRATATPATVAASNDHGIGGIILAYGQSNIGHWRADALTGGVDNAKGYVFHGLNSGWHPLSRDTSGGTGGAGGALAASEYVASSTYPTMVITQGVTGASATQLSKGNASGFYANMMAEVVALGGKLEGIFWEHGHSEAVSLGAGGNKAAYKALVAQIITDIRADTGQSAAELPVMITLMPPNPELIPAGTSANHLGYQTMRQAQIELAAEIPNARLSDHEMDAVFISEVPTYNGHYAATWLESGRRKSRGLAAQNGFVATDLRGALPLSCSVVGNVLTVNYDLNGGTALSLTGVSSDWQVAVNDAAFGTLNAITASAIVGTTLVLTLTVPLTAGQTVYVRNGYGYWFDRSNMLKTTYASGSDITAFPIVTALTAVA